jgi:hypothetical protein
MGKKRPTVKTNTGRIKKKEHTSCMVAPLSITEAIVKNMTDEEKKKFLKDTIIQGNGKRITEVMNRYWKSVGSSRIFQKPAEKNSEEVAKEIGFI